MRPEIEARDERRAASGEAQQPPASRLSPLAPRAAALFLLVFCTVPLVNWIPGGHEMPLYPMAFTWWWDIQGNFQLGDFAVGSMIVVGFAYVLALFSRQRMPYLWRPGAFDGAIGLWERHPVAAPAAIAGLAFVVYVLIAHLVLEAKPLLIDELAQQFQAQTFATGRLWRPAPPHPEFFSILHMLDTGGRWYAQFPPGGPAMMLPGILLGMPWIVNPLAGAASVLAWAWFLRTSEPRPGVRLGATLLFAFSPFVAYLAGSYMNHVTALTWAMVATAALAAVMASDRPRLGLAFLNGFALGACATIRPLDALAFAAPAAVWYLWRAFHDRRRWADALASAAGVAVPVLAMMWVNYHTTGGALRFGYMVLWGPSHALGFHSSPWGFSHSPARGAELISLMFLRLHTYLFETPVPSVAAAIVALALAKRASAYDRYLLAASALVVALYFAYWHDGFYLGPRFAYLLSPLLVLWTARLLPLLRERVGDGVRYRSTVYGFVVALAIAFLINIPLRGKQYRGGFTTMRFDVEGAARAAGIRNALVLVRESWGAQLVARMWALGVPRTETELIYRKVDGCLLEQAVSALEKSTVRDTAAMTALFPLLKDSARVIKSPFSPDGSEKVLPGTAYSARCVRRITEDREGFTLLGPLLLVRDGNVYARDLHARDTLLLRDFPGRRLYLLHPHGDQIDRAPTFTPVSMDSVTRAWALEAAEVP